MQKIKKEKNKNKKERGITLIALVITIIVLLILAGISIAMLSGDNSILSRAGQARDNSHEATREEQRRLTMLEAASNVNGEKYNGVKIPAGYAPTKKEGESTVDEGLVITDSEGNEYVWIEVPKNEVTYGSEFNLNYNFDSMSEEEKKLAYIDIATALRKYCTKDKNGKKLIALSGNQINSTMGWKDEYYDGCGIKDAETYIKLYNKMLKSTYENSGFWIGRYESGIKSPRNSKDDPVDNIIPLSKKDLYPINYIRCCDAQQIATNTPNKGNYTSSLMFGLQWDLVLKFLSNKDVETSLLTSNSTSWGNYKVEYNLNQKSVHGYKGIPTNGIMRWSAIESDYVHIAGENDYIALSTGASERNKQKNIYDLAGNMEEYTLEHCTSITVQPCSIRGCPFTINGWGSTVSYRGPYVESYAFNTSRITSFNILSKIVLF